MSRPTVINIGWARAGSTAFRQNFLARHPDILAVGRGQPASEGPGGLILDCLKAAGDDEFAVIAPDLKAEWDAYVRANPDRVVCLTDEELSIGLPGGARPAAIAARCRLLFPRARILAIVRDQADAVRSFHALSQREGLGETMAYPDWVRRFFLEPTEGKGFAYLFAYAETLRAYRAGGGEVLALPHERLKHDHGTLYAEVARWLGVSGDALAALPNDVVNASGATAVLAEDQRAEIDRKIGALFSADNRALSDDFGRDLLSTDAAAGKQ